jgi:hypothetical protein
MAIRTIACENYADITIILHTAEAPSDEEWDFYLRKVEELRKSYRGTLAITDGGAPTTKQRARMKAENEPGAMAVRARASLRLPVMRLGQACLVVSFESMSQARSLRALASLERSGRGTVISGRL